MKNRYTKYPLFALLATALLVGCETHDKDAEFLESIDPTAPAYTIFYQGFGGVTSACGALVAALNFDEYLAAPDETTRYEVEDRYYTDQKVREIEPSYWRIHSQRWSWDERYKLLNDLLLCQEGARWEIVGSPQFFGPTLYEESAFVECLGVDKHTIQTNDVGVWVTDNYRNDYYSRYQVSPNALLTGTFTIESNNSYYRKGPVPELILTVEGSGWVKDASNKNYAIKVEITEPLRITVDVNGHRKAGTTGKMHLTLTTPDGTHESVDVTMSPMNAIVVDYTTGDATLCGYYDWSGQSISPR